VLATVNTPAEFVEKAKKVIPKKKQRKSKKKKATN
jgi:hypothetical protein